MILIGNGSLLIRCINRFRERIEDLIHHETSLGSLQTSHQATSVQSIYKSDSSHKTSSSVKSSARRVSRLSDFDIDEQAAHRSALFTIVRSLPDPLSHSTPIFQAKK